MDMEVDNEVLNNNNKSCTNKRPSSKSHIFLASKKYKSIASDLVQFLIRYHKYQEYESIFHFCLNNFVFPFRGTLKNGWSNI